MGVLKKSLVVSGAAAGTVFTACLFIPVVGGLVGIVAGGVTFLVVESGALIGIGTVAAGAGIYHAIKDHKHKHDKHKTYEYHPESQNVTHSTTSRLHKHLPWKHRQNANDSLVNAYQDTGVITSNSLNNDFNSSANTFSLYPSAPTLYSDPIIPSADMGPTNFTSFRM